MKWVLRTKSDGSKKARILVRGFEQHDFGETCAPTLKLTPLRMMLTKAAAHDWEIEQDDVITAFLYGPLPEGSVVYMEPPEQSNTKPEQVWKLKNALYGLKEAHKCWHDKFSKEVTSLRLTRSHEDSCLFVGEVDGVTFYLLVFLSTGICR